MAKVLVKKNPLPCLKLADLSRTTFVTRRLIIILYVATQNFASLQYDCLPKVVRDKKVLGKFREPLLIDVSRETPELFDYRCLVDLTDQLETVQDVLSPAR